MEPNQSLVPLTGNNQKLLVATKAAHIRLAARGEPVLGFGLRPADWIGGGHATSNALASRIHGFPLRDTHARRWIISHADEPTANQACADALPNYSQSPTAELRPPAPAQPHNADLTPSASFDAIALQRNIHPTTRVVGRSSR